MRVCRNANLVHQHRRPQGREYPGLPRSRGFPTLEIVQVVANHITVLTSGKGTYEITEKIESLVSESGVQNGAVTVFVQHTSCSLIVMENADPSARRDLEKFFDQLVPEEAQDFEHTSEGADDMPSHIRMVLTRTSETIPINRGKLQLGTWQGLFLFEHRRAPHRRKIAATVIGI